MRPSRLRLPREVSAQLPSLLVCNAPGPEAYLSSWPRVPVTCGAGSEATVDRPVTDCKNKTGKDWLKRKGRSSFPERYPTPSRFNRCSAALLSLLICEEVLLVPKPRCLTKSHSTLPVRKLTSSSHTLRIVMVATVTSTYAVFLPIC